MTSKDGHPDRHLVHHLYGAGGLFSTMEHGFGSFIIIMQESLSMQRIVLIVRSYTDFDSCFLATWLRSVGHHANVQFAAMPGGAVRLQGRDQ